MMRRQPVLRVLFVSLLLFVVFGATAQPTLPDLAGSADKGVVVLSWMCQYEGVKSIAVMRSMDSNKINKNIGYVKELTKGLQAFADGHPEAGKNFYKLAITFKSGLVWMSNRLSVYVDKAAIQDQKTVLPGNDSLQHFVVSETMEGGKGNVGSSPGGKDTAQRHKLVISFDVDSNAVNTDVIHHVATPSGRKITVTFDDAATNAATVVQYRFISVNAQTGNIHMNLPDDVGTHHYSIKFYDDHEHMVIEVPKISREKIIFDRRNFQKRGLYKFVIRKDVVELESGYIAIGQ